MGLLEVRDIHTYYGDSYVLQGVSLRVDKSQVVGILGRNGMGKTTLIRSIIGFTPPRAGQVVFKGRDITGWPSNRAVGLGMALVPQGRRMFASLTVVENLAVAARDSGGPWTLDTVMDLFPRLRERAQSRAGKLSGGEQQMLAIGRALMTNPDFLLMDEPTEGLAPLLVREVGRVIGDLRARGLSILLVEQNIPLATHGWRVRPEGPAAIPGSTRTSTRSPTARRACGSSWPRLGADRAAMGSDYPFDMGGPDPVPAVRDAGLDPPARALVEGGTAARFLGL